MHMCHDIFREGKVNEMLKKALLLAIIVLVLTVAPLTPVPPVLASDPTTTITINKYDTDGETVIDQVTVDYEYMKDNLPVQGNGITHYYHQGPTFDYDNLWDPGEMVNIDSRDYGAVMGTDVKDLCELLTGGGAATGDEIEIKSPDGFTKRFAYEDVYNPEPEQGKMVITWYQADFGFVPNYDTGMRLVFFAETTNPEGKYVFGDWDMHETLAEEYWHYYVNYPDFWPSSSGLSVKWVSEINIYSSGGSSVNTASDSLVARANVVLQSIGIALNRDTIDFGNIAPGQNSAVEPVSIFNTGSNTVSVTLEVSADSDTAEDFYERSLYIDEELYNGGTVIANVGVLGTQTVDTQLRVPADWTEAGLQEAQFIFWAESPG